MTERGSHGHRSERPRHRQTPDPVAAFFGVLFSGTGLTVLVGGRAALWQTTAGVSIFFAAIGVAAVVAVIRRSRR